MKVGLVFPFVFEAASLIGDLAMRRLRGSPFQVYRVEYEDNDVFLLICGQGEERSFRGTEYLIQKFSPEFLIHAGTGGGLLPGIKLFTTVWGRKFKSISEKEEIDFGFNRYLNLFPGELRVKNEEDTAGLILTVPRIARNESEAARYHSLYSAILCEMETFGFVRASEKNKVPYVVFRVVSDIPDSNTVNQFRKNQKKSSEVISKKIKIILEKLLKKV